MSTVDIFNMTDTWNAAGTTFTAIKMNVTNTASAAGSSLIDLQVDSSSVFKVVKDGSVVIGTTGITVDFNSNELLLDADGNTSIHADTDNQIDIKINAADDFRFTVDTFTALSGSSIATDTIAETTAASGVTIDSLLIKDGGIADDFALSGVISPAQIAGQTDDYAPAGLATASTLRLSTDASQDLTGITGGTSGRILFLHNVGAQNLVLKDESASSTAANRFALVSDITVPGDESIQIQYDATSSRWRNVSVSTALTGISGPVSSTDEGIMRWNGTGGTVAQDSSVRISDNDTIFIPELAAADADVPGEGQVWVRNDTPNKLFFTDDAGTDFDLSASSGDNIDRIVCTNAEGAQLDKGDIVSIDKAGTPWDAGNSRPNVILSDADVVAEMPALGMVEATSAIGASVTVVTYGQVTGFDTTGAGHGSPSDGDDFYTDFATPGNWTVTRPAGAAEQVQKLGTVLLANASGAVLISGANRANDIPNVVDLNGLADALVLDADGDTTISAPTDDQIDFEIGGADELRLTATALYPATDDGLTLGITNTNEWADAFFASGATIGFDNSNVVITHSAGKLNVSTGSFEVGGNNVTGLESFVVAVSNETAALTTGTAKVTFRMPHAFTLLAGANGAKASVTTAPTGSALTVDINEGGTTILSTKLTIDATEKTSATAATPPVISDTSLAADGEITIDIDGVGSTIAGAGLKVMLVGYQT